METLRSMWSHTLQFLFTLIHSHNNPALNELAKRPSCSIVKNFSRITFMFIAMLLATWLSKPLFQLA